ncbi:MAG: hypothetical protein HRU16_04210 [Planctomycetes bacterium]|nr:hypothetical protein [Planctomycetota bacterium]
MAGQFYPLFSVPFVGVSTITVTHNLGRMQVGVIIRVGDEARNDMLVSVAPSVADPRNEVVVVLASSQTGEVLVFDTDYVFANMPSPEDAASIADGGGTDRIACCPFGAKSDSTGKFLIANGKSSDGDDSTKPKTRQPIGITGTLIVLAYKTKEATNTTLMKIHVNGSVEATVPLANINANFGGVETISVSVVAGDYVEIEYDDDDKPGESTMYFIMEPS